jgi:hypothetical protein|tara:strand:+ start:400 stop:717 length:318 start_codon:yes stop_codon:yes gene_type:complete
MKIQPPKRIKILNLTYKVELCSKTVWVGSAADGWCDFDNQTIVVYEGLADEAKADTFLHECIHAVAHLMGVEWTKEEQVSRRIATGLCTLWKENPSAFRWWRNLL